MKRGRDGREGRMKVMRRDAGGRGRRSEGGWEVRYKNDEEEEEEEEGQ